MCKRKQSFQQLFFLCHQNTRNKQTGSAWNFPEVTIQVCRCRSTIYYNATFFCWPSFLRLITTLVLQDQCQCYIPLYFNKFFRVLSLARALAEFSVKPVYFTMVEKNFHIHGFTFLENALNLGILLMSRFSSQSKLSLSSYHHPQAKGNYSFFQATFLQKYISHNSKKRWNKV